MLSIIIKCVRNVGSNHHLLLRSIKSNLTYHNHSRPLFLQLNSRSLSSGQLQSAMPYPPALSIQPENPPESKKQSWKEASSLIILAKKDSESNLKNEFDYELLMVKRSAGSSFFASAFVFPGGQVELSDFDLKWYDLYKQMNIPREHLDSISEDIIGPRPPIITDPITLKYLSNKSRNDFINLDIGLRISAIRETFEEAGILILTDRPRKDGSSYCSMHTSKSLSIDLNEWQLAVRNDSNKFYELCKQVKMVPDVWSLFEWSNWLTPVNVGHRRFDTIFYVCCFEREPLVMVDNEEITKPLWCNPTTILEQHHQEQVFLAPPQVYELSRMLQFPELSRFRKYLSHRQTLGTQRWLPVIYTFDDGAISLVPGDERYPTIPELISTKPSVQDIPGSIHQANAQDKHKNRMELMGIRCRTICNVEPGCGHLAPITYPPTTTNNNAKL